MFKFLHHLLNPHCEHCREEREDARVCASCEILKLEIERLRLENARLLHRILEKPQEEVRHDTSDLQPIMPKTIPWNTRRQILETQDRDTAQRLKENLRTSTDDLEKELGIVENERTK